MRSQRHLRDIYGADSGGQSMPVTGIRSPTTAAGAAAETDAITVTLTRVDGGPAAGISVAASSAAGTGSSTVTREAVTNNAGVAIHTITHATTGTSTVTFTTASGAVIGTVAVTTS